MTILLLLIAAPTLLLAASFGIAWPLVRYGRRNLDAWRNESNSLKKLIYIGLFFAIAGVGVGFVFFDWIFNVVFATAFFRELPYTWSELLTDRIQAYLHDWAAGRKFNSIERAYIRLIVRIANGIDKSPHFFVPSGTA